MVPNATGIGKDNGEMERGKNEEVCCSVLFLLFWVFFLLFVFLFLFDFFKSFYLWGLWKEEGKICKDWR